MSHGISLLLLFLVSLASGGKIPENEELTIPSLAGPRRHLMVRPVTSYSDQLPVSVGFNLLDVDVDEANDKATLGGWLNMEWVDIRLAWSENGVNSTRVSPADIWTPDVEVYNRVPVTSSWLLPMPPVVYPSGKVIYVPTVSFTVHCQRNQTEQHDRFTCPLKLGSWTHNLNEMDLVLKDGANTVETSEFLHNGRWVVESSSLVRKEKLYPCCPEKYVSIEGSVVLKPQRS